MCAPNSGFVKAVNSSIGQSLTPTNALFEIVNPEHLPVARTVFERDILQVKEGQHIPSALGNSLVGRGRTACRYRISKPIS
jgi:cobalt-zinc-cadmium efflux system membrane fusion protein